MKKYRLKKDLPMLEAGNEVLLELKKINDKKIGLYYDIKIPNDNRVFDSFGIIGKSKINEWLEEVVEKPKSVWDLGGGDGYFVIKDGIVDDCIIYNYGLMNKFRDLGDVFLTREEAEKEARRREAIQKIKKYCWENGIEAEYEEERNSKLFYIEIDGEFEGQINFDSFPPVYSPIGYFSYENAEKILENFEEELKIILDV